MKKYNFNPVCLNFKLPDSVHLWTRGVIFLVYDLCQDLKRLDIIRIVSKKKRQVYKEKHVA